MKLYPLLFSHLFLFIGTTIFAQLPETTLIEDPLTVITFDEDEFHFGEIEQGEKVRHIYRFTNTGDSPLVISNAKGSCGCTVPSWPMAPIAPGETGEIEVQFDSKGKKGKQSKRVTITANTDPAQTFLSIIGEVNVPDTPDLSDDNAAKWNTESAGSHSDCVSIYPNPTSEVLRLDIKEHLGKSALIHIYNDLGQPLENKSVTSISSESVSFDVSQYQPGIYTVSIQIDDEKSFTKCFVVMNN